MTFEIAYDPVEQTLVIPGVLRVDPPVGGQAPLVVDSPHSGTDYPQDFRVVCDRDGLRQAEDTHVEALVASAPSHGATFLQALFPRSYIDVNRGEGDIDPALLADQWDTPLSPGPKTKLGMGLVRRFSRAGEPMYRRPLASASVRHRISAYYRPYHRMLDRLLDQSHERFGIAYYLDCHSMPSVGTGMSVDEGRARADFVLGDRDGTTCEPGIVEVVESELRRLGFTVLRNDPFKGVELVRRHGRPVERRHALQIEVNRGLYMNERTLVRGLGFTQIVAAFDQVLAAVAAYAHTQAKT